MSTGVARVRVRACQEYSYRRAIDMALTGVAQLQSTPLCEISRRVSCHFVQLLSVFATSCLLGMGACAFMLSMKTDEKSTHTIVG